MAPDGHDPIDAVFVWFLEAGSAEDDVVDLGEHLVARVGNEP
jgi:hypothetical protein